jgi:AcrR family transcriptional regulator
MGRPKLRTREDILASALSLYWRKGPMGVTVQELEVATGVNKSGLYAEFKDKDSLFIATVKYYAESAEKVFFPILKKVPTGKANLREYLIFGLTYEGEGGCFLTNCMRDYPSLTPKARLIVKLHFAQLKELFGLNLADSSKADLVLTFDQGLCLRAFMGDDTKDLLKLIDEFLITV